jgi:hypothetical protein
MRDASRAILAIILVASPTWSAAAHGRPLSPDETQILEKARALALEYTANLPNFICTETIRRSQLPKRSQTWKLLDTLVVDLEFSDRGERHKLLTINGKPAKKAFSQVGGVGTNSEFGSTLAGVFSLKSAAMFNWERLEELGGRPTFVFLYRIEQDHGGFKLNRNKHHIITPLEGLVYVDRETNRVVKITAVPSGIPAGWAITGFPQEFDYGFAEISGQTFFLPLHAQLDVTLQNGSQNRNEYEFGNYRKFSGEATLQFGSQ